MAKDWDAVAAAIRGRLVDLDMTQADLAGRAGVALMTVRELQHNLSPDVGTLGRCCRIGSARLACRSAGTHP